ncbi:MAG: DUF2254 domain-containing protein [Actinomycetota bacterium]|nr:DUF2254 domain-containing protein [Actinomycetota bacterium]
MKGGLLNAVRDTVRTQLWPLPVLGATVALILGMVLPRVDRSVDASLPSWLRSLLFSGDPGAARTVLDAVSSSLITVTSLTFSLTVVTLQLASSQFSPRLLRTFTSDVFVQATLGLFLATFTFSLTVLRSVRSSGDAQAVFVPEISVTVSFVLAVASVIGLVVFLAHLARQIRVETMLRDVHTDMSATIEAVLAPRDEEHADAGPALTPPPYASILFAKSSGFLVRVDENALIDCSMAHDVLFVIDAHPGASLVAGTPIGSLWSPTGALSPQDLEQLHQRIGHGMHIGFERTAAQDVGYGLRQLTDVVNKALSPGINDPTTAVHALGHISAVLCELAGRQLGPVRLRDDEGQVRVLLARPELADLVDVAITQPRRYGKADPQVMARLFRLLEELAWHTPTADQPVIKAQLNRLDATVEGCDFDATETEQLRHARARVTDALSQRHGRDRGAP